MPNQIVRVGLTQKRNAKAVPGYVLASAGDTITWAKKGCNTLVLDLPSQVFAQTHHQTNHASYSVQTKMDAQPGIWEYSATCDGVPAEGGSMPGIIIE